MISFQNNSFFHIPKLQKKKKNPYTNMKEKFSNNIPLKYLIFLTQASRKSSLTIFV